MKCNNLARGIAIALMATTAGLASAAFEIIPKEQPVPVAVAETTAKGGAVIQAGSTPAFNESRTVAPIEVYSVTEIGFNKKDSHKTSFGDNIPLDAAMALIMPDGWQFLPKNSVGNPKVSWKATGKWLNAVNQIAFYNKINFIADWNKKIMFAHKDKLRLNPEQNIEKLQSLKKGVPSIDENLAGFGADTISGLIDSFLPDGWTIDLPEELKAKRVNWKGGKPVSEVLKDAFIQAGARIEIDRDNQYINVYWFTLKSGQRLSTELKRWAENEGWSFLWRLDQDFYIESDTVFPGNFKQAFYRVIQAYQENGALLNVEPQASSYNKTARIKPHKEH